MLFSVKFPLSTEWPLDILVNGQIEKNNLSTLYHLDFF